MDWISYAKYSKYHPDNLVKVAHALPEPVRAPPPVLALNDIDKQMGGWGHKLCCERPYGQQETTTRIKAGVTAKVGSTWRTTESFERGNSISSSAMYGGSYREKTFEELVELKGKKP